MNTGGSLRVGHIKHANQKREVKLSYGRNWVWKAPSDHQLSIFPKMQDETWGGSAILPRIMASHFAEDYVRLLTGADLTPDFLLCEGFSSSRWESKIGEWVYFIELTWSEPDVPLALAVSIRGALHAR